MSRGYRLNNLFSLAKSMKNKKIDYQVINNIPYKKDLEICAIFKYDYKIIKKRPYTDNSQPKEYILGLFKRKTHQYLTLPLDYKKSDNFESLELPNRLGEDLFKDLMKFLELNGTERREFSLHNFYRILDKATPTKAGKENFDRLVCSHSYPTSKDNEHNKIYFSHFRDNDKRGEKRSLENYEKTEKLLPYANKVIGNRNISVCFTPEKKEEAVEKKEADIKIKVY